MVKLAKFQKDEFDVLVMPDMEAEFEMFPRVDVMVLLFPKIL